MVPNRCQVRWPCLAEILGAPRTCVRVGNCLPGVKRVWERAQISPRNPSLGVHFCFAEVIQGFCELGNAPTLAGQTRISKEHLLVPPAEHGAACAGRGLQRRTWCTFRSLQRHCVPSTRCCAHCKGEHCDNHVEGSGNGTGLATAVDHQEEQEHDEPDHPTTAAGFDQHVDSDATDDNMESLRACSESRGWDWQDVLVGRTEDDAEDTAGSGSH